MLVFRGWSCCDVRADLGSLVSLKLLFGFGNQSFSFSFVCSFLSITTMYVELHQDITYTEFTFILFSRSANTNMTIFGYKNGRYLTRVSMGLTDRRKTAKNLVDSRKN